MSTSTLLIAILIALMFSAGLASIILRFTRPKLIQNLEPSGGSLNSPIRVGNPGLVRSTFLASSSGTFMVYIFCSVPLRTAVLGTQLQPISLFRIGNVIQFQILPGSIQQPPKTQLVIRTQSEKAESETIPVADFPQQKWILLTVVREGRRYTVYYNDKVVANSRTQYYPTINSSELVLGHPQMQGEFYGPNLFATALRKDEIVSALQQTSDTRHEPYKPVSLVDIFTIKFGCPGGIFCPSVNKVPQSNPLQEWKSPYA